MRQYAGVWLRPGRLGGAGYQAGYQAKPRPSGQEPTLSPRSSGEGFLLMSVTPSWRPLRKASSTSGATGLRWGLDATNRVYEVVEVGRRDGVSVGSQELLAVGATIRTRFVGSVRASDEATVRSMGDQTDPGRAWVLGATRCVANGCRDTGNGEIGAPLIDEVFERLGGQRTADLVFQ